jgi:hypothetical protein
MAVLVMAESQLTAEHYDAMVNLLEAKMKAAQGLVAHVGWPSDGGWRVIEIWETNEAANQFFAKEVHPNLPPGAKPPKRSVHALHRIIRPG